MKKFFAILMVALVSAISVSAASDNNRFGVKDLANVVIEQTITFNDGKTIVVYYQLEGNNVAAYSESDCSKYNLSDLANVKSSSERRVSAVKGKRVAKYSFGAIKRIVAKMIAS